MLCLLHDVLQHYTDLKDLKRTIVNTRAIDRQVAACVYCHSKQHRVLVA
jgi:hypothetical protein